MGIVILKGTDLWGARSVEEVLGDGIRGEPSADLRHAILGQFLAAFLAGSEAVGRRGGLVVKVGHGHLLSAKGASAAAALKQGLAHALVIEGAAGTARSASDSHDELPVAGVLDLALVRVALLADIVLGQMLLVSEGFLASAADASCGVLEGEADLGTAILGADVAEVAHVSNAAMVHSAAWAVLRAELVSSVFDREVKD